MISFFDGIGRGIVKVSKKSEILKVKDGVVVSKFCVRHGEFLPIEEFYFTKSGSYATYCRECCSELTVKGKKKYVKTRRDAQGILQYRCSKCKEFKYLVDFVKDSGRSSGRSYNCKACKSKYYKKRKETNGKAV